MRKILLLYLLILINLPCMGFDIPDNKRVSFWLKEFTVNRRTFIDASLMRSGIYRKTVADVLKKKGLPAELVWLPLIESGYNCAAISGAAAAGCWQFIRQTGEAYGLKKGAWKDERYDFIRSTNAAADYLKQLNKQFNDWDLTLAAYNCGPGKVRRAIKKAGKANYWKLQLPEETMHYVPQFYAVLSIVSDLKRYGFRDSTGELIAVRLRKGSHNLRYIASRVLQVDYRLFFRLNPGFEVGITPPDRETVIYLMKDWDVAMLNGFGLLAQKKGHQLD